MTMIIREYFMAFDVRLMIVDSRLSIGDWRLEIHPGAEIESKK
jgi:hypothetical protein